jgi:hypothetical protein
MTDPCTKLAYATEKAARKKLSGVRKKRMWQRKGEQHVECRVYKCALCHKFHLTSRPYED